MTTLRRAAARFVPFSFVAVLCCFASSAAAQESRVPKWDARGVGRLPVQGITSLDVSPDGSRITVGTIAPTGTPNVHVLDRDGKLVKSYVVNQRWIAQVAGAANDRAFALTTMATGSAFDEPTVVAAGEPSQPISGGMGGFSFFHYGDHSNHTGKQLVGFDGGAVTTNEYQVVWLDAGGATTQALATPKSTANYRNLKTTVLAAHRSGVAVLGGYANYPASEGVKAPTPTNNLFVYKPGEQKPVWSRPTVDDVAPSTPPEKGEYGNPKLADGSQNPLPQRDEPIFAPLSVAVTNEKEFSDKTLIATADYRGYQRVVRSSATGLDQVIGARFMPAKPTITVYDGAGKVVRRFDAAKFDKACWVDLAFTRENKILVAYPHSWASRGLAGQAMLPADDDAGTLWYLNIETGEVSAQEFPDAIASVVPIDDGLMTAVSCWNGRLYLGNSFFGGEGPGKPAILASDEANKRLIAATTSGEVIIFNEGVMKRIDLNKLVPYVEQWYTSKANAAKLSDHVWELPGGRVESDLGGQRVIVAPQGLILIEGHAGLSFEREWKGIETAGLDPREVKYILTTHEHGDHSPGAYLWRVVTGAQFICSRQMAYTLQHHLPDGTGYGLHPPVPVDKRISEEEVLDLAGLRVVALRLPGHTFGSMGWLFELDGKRWVAIGDLIMPDGRLGYAGSINFSPQQVLESLRKLDSLRVDTILPGHGPVVGPDRYVAAGIAFGSRVGWGKMTPEKADPRFRIEQDNMLVAGFLAEAASADFGDMDGDGLPDVVIVAPANAADAKAGSVVKVYLNKTEREPRFDPLKPDFTVAVPGIGPPKKIRLRLLNADKKTDIVVFDSGNVAMLASREKLGEYDIRTSDAQEAYQIRMLDRREIGGGRPVVFGQFAGAHAIVADKTGKLRSEILEPKIRTAYTDIRELDLNSDGRADWVSNDGTIRLRDAEGKIPAEPTIRLALPAQGEWHHLGIGDVNGDRRPDLVVAQREGKVFTFFHTGDGAKPYAPEPSTTLQLTVKPPETIVHARDAASVADWNSDGIDDLLFGMSQRDEVVVLLGGPQGLSLDRQETIKLDVQLHFEHSVKVMDFNADGRPDLGLFAIVPGGPFTPYVWLQPERAAAGAKVEKR
jgi:hydroxyacylglutathione hydrolase